MSKLRTVFVRTGNGELQPNNFGNALVSAANDGVVSREWLAALLGADVSHIRKAGNGLSGRRLEHVSQAVAQAYEQHNG